jgi:hypothetical protein
VIIVKVKLIRRWSSHRAGESVEVSDSQGTWLIQHSYAASSGDVLAPSQAAAMPGADGPDPLAGGDATRLRPRSMRSDRDKAEGVLGAAPKSSPAYRPGFDADASGRQGVVGRDEVAPSAAQDAEKPARRRSKSGS